MKVISYSKTSKTSIRYDRKERLYIKSSYDSEGIHNIKNEYEGFNWYFSKKGGALKLKSESLKLKSKKGFAKLEIPEIKGYKVPVERGIYHNEKYIINAINEYVRIYDYNFRFHGDFSIGNLIFNNLGTFIIDWEHSNDKLKIWGLDVLNLYYDSLFFSIKTDGKIRLNELKSAKFIYKYILNNFIHLNKNMISFQELICIFNDNKSLWGSSYAKLPILKFNKLQLKVIEKIQKDI